MAASFSVYRYVSVLFVIFLVSIENGLSFDCPTKCTCVEATFKVMCKNKNLTSAGLTEIASEITNETKALDLSGNLIEKFDVFVVLSDLEELILNKNVLTVVPSKISEFFPKLTSLRLTSNNIKSIKEDDFAGFKMLDMLRVDDNKLTTLTTGTFRALGNLRQLYAGSNQISHIEKEAFFGLSSLVTLNLDHNRMTEIPLDLFDNLNNLHSNLVVNLPFNEISTIPNGLFTKLNNFSLFDLTNNNIDTIEDRAFADVNAGSLNLFNNSLSSFLPSSFEGFKFKNFLIDTNPINCDCQLMKFITFLKILNSERLFYGKCETPAERKGQQTSNLYTMDKATLEEALCTVCDLNNTCLNHGVCILVNKTQIQCKCNTKFEGEDCSVPVANDDRIRTIVLSAVIGVFVVVVSVVLIVCFVRHQKRKNEETLTADEKVTYNAINK